MGVIEIYVGAGRIYQTVKWVGLVKGVCRSGQEWDLKPLHIHTHTHLYLIAEATTKLTNKRKTQITNHLSTILENGSELVLCIVKGFSISYSVFLFFYFLQLIYPF